MMSSGPACFKSSPGTLSTPGDLPSFSERTASVRLVKCADDTKVESLIDNSDATIYHRDVDGLVAWCENSNLELNTSKTKEMIVDFRKKKTPVDPLLINGAIIDSVDCFKFLGTTISNTLGWDANVDVTVKKAQQRLYFLRQLRKFGLRGEIIVQVYSSVIERRRRGD